MKESKRKNVNSNEKWYKTMKVQILERAFECQNSERVRRFNCENTKIPTFKRIKIRMAESVRK